MIYTVQISSRGTITIPKAVRNALGSSKILIIQKGDSYIFKPIKKITTLGKSLKTTKNLSDEDIQKLRANTFLRPKNMY